MKLGFSTLRTRRRTDGTGAGGHATNCEVTRSMVHMRNVPPAWNARVLRETTGDILRAQWDAPQTVFDAPCQRCCRWQQQEIIRSSVMESSVRHQRTRPTGVQQHRIAIEFAARYRESGQWIERVMFNQTDHAAGTDDPLHLAQKADPLRWRHMMQHTDCYRKIEGRALVGKGLARIGVVLDLGVPDPGLSDAGRGDVDAAYSTEHSPYEWMNFADATANIEHVGIVHPVQPCRNELAQRIHFSRCEKAVRKAGEVNR